MRDYVPKKGKYVVPTAVWHQTVWTIRDYARLKEEYYDILDESPAPPDGMPRGTNIGDPTAHKAIKVEKIKDQINAVERAVAYIPVDYRKGIWDNIIARKRYPMDASRETYSRWKARYIYEVARGLGLV